MTMTPELKDLLPELLQTLADHSGVILQAPPGSGKTTQVPLAFLDVDWLHDQKILMLEPRRLAARACARYMASLLGESVGQTVGFRVRQESKISARTRIEVVTEGVLTRMLQNDPSLEGYGLVIFDEFHERSLQADLGLALCREVQQALREDLRILLMSATLASERLSQLLDFPVLSCQGRQYPVEMRYAPAPVNQPLIPFLSRLITQILAQETGSLLVFLPGAGEIKSVQKHLEEHLKGQSSISVHPLYGDLSAQAQDAAIQPPASGQRKVVLATNLAETSLTIEGIRIVIDSGQARVPFFDANSGLTRLETRPISRASAEQRAGRAGRLEPGICLRAWHESDTARLHAEIQAEILSSDLALLALELALWGCSNPTDLAWLDPPPEAHWQQAIELLRSLQALDAQGRITEHGRALAKFPLTPRLAHMVLKGHAAGYGGLACSIAALLSERDLLAGQSRESDLNLRLQALAGKRSVPAHRREFVLQAAQQIAAAIHSKPAFGPAHQTAYLLGLAYPERIAQRRPGSAPRYLLANGKGASLHETDILAREPYLVIAHLDGQSREARIFLAAALDPDPLDDLTAGQIVTSQEVDFDPHTGRVQASERQMYGALVLAEKRIAKPDASLISRALIQGLRKQGLQRLPWNKALEQWCVRVQFLHQQIGAPWPDMSEQSLSEQLESWLMPFLNGLQKLEAIHTDILKQALEYRLGYSLLTELERLAPAHLTVPTGSQIRLDYTGPEPILAVRLQELFGLAQTPRILDDRFPVLIHLLSPAQRPVQMTRDLASFWRETYPEVKKELKGRYPKHYWPDDPLQAEPTRGIKRK